MNDMSKIRMGKAGEQIAVAYLKKKGYRICETNFRCPLGEIDVVARDNRGELVFVEVKTRTSRDLGYPEQAVGIKKQRKLSQLAAWYMQQQKVNDTDARFDVVAITLLPEETEITLIANAFDFIGS